MDSKEEYREEDLEKISFLKELDNSLRCHICKELYRSPVIGPCSHSYCSFCIRKSLDVDKSCPECRREITASSLRPNKVVEDIVTSYKLARRRMIETVQDLEAKKREVESLTKVQDSQDRQDSESNRPKRRIDDEGQTSELSPRKHERNENDSSNNKEQEYDTNWDPNNEQSVKRRRTRSGVKGSGFSYADDTAPHDFMTVGDEVIEIPDSDEEEYREMGECPVCHEEYPIEIIESQHIIDCLNGTVKKQRNKSEKGKRDAFAGPEVPRRIGEMPFNNLAKVRQRLSDFGLINRGSRQLLEARYREWMHLWNSNVDSSRPESEATLRKKMNDWEQNIAPKLDRKGEKGILDIEPDDWKKQHSSSFIDLVNAAKQSMKKKEQLEQKKEKMEEEEKKNEKEEKQIPEREMMDEASVSNNV